jgi:DnaK suppressor protein
LGTNRYKQALLAKQDEVETEIARLRSEARDSRGAEVEDPIDVVTSTESQASAFELSARLTDVLGAVRDALLRIEEGSYGRCVECGREIEQARLNAVPWTPYCKADQEKRDAIRAARAAAGNIS